MYSADGKCVSWGGVTVWEEVRARTGPGDALRGAHFVGKEAWTLGFYTRTHYRVNY